MIDPDVRLWWTVDGVLSPDECRRWIERIEAEGPAPAPITTGRGFEMRPDIRNNDRVTLDDVDAASLLFDRLRGELPAAMMRATCSGLNERFRCYRYNPGQRFAPHYDGWFGRNDVERSTLTVMVYLNEGFVGGATRFLDMRETVVPKTGRVLVFQHLLLHEGQPVVEGTKYVLRTDAMYTRSAVDSW